MPPSGGSIRGRRVNNGVVVYIVLEGAHGVTARIEAFREKFLDGNGKTPDFFLLSTRLALPTDREQLIVDIQARLGKLLVAAIVLDTLNRSIEGSESDDKDMGAYIKSVDAIRETFCCAVIVVLTIVDMRGRARADTPLSWERPMHKSLSEKRMAS